MNENANVFSWTMCFVFESNFLHAYIINYKVAVK